MLSSGPSYISSRSADVILSDVRPIKLSCDALQATNVFLDELLYNILNVSQSLSTDHLKAALTKVLPTSIGKEALLEAEVELKAYWERTTPNGPGAADNGESGFDLQWSFELLRLKCEAYSTMNDSDEDADAERRLNDRMSKAGSSPAPKASLLAPAALYLTAILESTCEHILSNVSRVAARDSSRTIASIQDVFVALCEDDSMYGMFKTMKVYEQIEVLSRAQKPRRSKSFTRGSDKISSPSRTSSPHAELVSLRDSAPTSSRVRMSSESLRSSATTVIASPEPRTSMEKARSVRKFMSAHSRSSSDKDTAAEISRAQAEYSKSRGSAEFEDDYDLLHEFDELMRSNATMKVSLTPDRLKSMEVYNKERSQRANRRGTREPGQPSDQPPAPSDNLPPPTTQEPTLKHNGSITSRPSVRQVDSILEDEEEPSPTKKAPMAYHSSAAVRARQGSLSNAAARSTPSPTRLRSISISNMPHPRHEDSLSRRTGGSKPHTPTSATSPQPKRTVSVSNGMPAGIPGQPPRKRRVARNRESIDLDDVMGVSDDETEEAAVRPSPATRSVSAASTPVKPKQASTQPYVSQNARDLIAFLEEGPPDEPHFPHSSSANASVISFESSRAKAGRFSRMMSKLTIGGSTERLNGRVVEEPPRTPRVLGRKPSRSNIPPPPAYMQPSLSSKRSMPNVIIGTPPRSHAVPSPGPLSASATLATYSMQPSPVSSHPALPVTKVTPPPTATGSSSQTTSAEDLGLPTSPSRRATLRKAVPAFDELGDVPPVPVPAELEKVTAMRTASVRQHLNGHSEVDGGKLADDVIKGPSVQRKNSTLTVDGQVNGTALRLYAHENGQTSPSITPLSVPRPSSRSRLSSGKGEDRTSSRTPSEGRSPITPASAAGPSIAASDVDDLRRLLSAATTADECRLLMDMFFARNGFPYRTPPPSASPSLDTTLVELETLNNELECSLVELFLNGCEVEEVEVTETAHPPDVVQVAVVEPADAAAQSPTEDFQTPTTAIPVEMVAA